MKSQYSVYFAGELFSHKDLIGNRLLAAGIERHSHGRYQCFLPQHLESGAARSVEIRNGDLLALLKCDLALFNFDGAELDSGTVVEFIIAKMLDMPAVILRSDFRSGGDQQQDNWNLMCSGYPRTKVVNLNAMDWYQQQLDIHSTGTDKLDQAYNELARPVIDALDAVLKEPALVSAVGPSLDDIYAWALRFPGGGFADAMPAEELKQLLARKIAKGIYPNP